MYEKLCLVGYAMGQWAELYQRFKVIMLPSSYDRWKRQAKNQQGSVCDLVHIDILLYLFFDPEDEKDISLRNVNWISAEYMELYPRTQNFPLLHPPEPWILQALYNFV
jgi:hypothetical protein